MTTVTTVHGTNVPSLSYCLTFPLEKVYVWVWEPKFRWYFLENGCSVFKLFKNRSMKLHKDWREFICDYRASRFYTINMSVKIPKPILKIQFKNCSIVISCKMVGNHADLFLIRSEQFFLKKYIFFCDFMPHSLSA